ncbi:MAG: threonylcarbamoyl-AMP synthase [Candidatus Omnitrophica bacterium]|nr:threonylcarbamoyl-AMP synthase [Candidatus Omnitrophota bacterium]
MNLFRKTRILKIDSDEPEEEGIDIAADILKNGGLVAAPTETVYGLGANLLNKKAVERVYRVKRRPKERPLTIHLSDMKILNSMAAGISPVAQKLINRFWPGPLTIILYSKDGKKVGFRMPSGKIIRSLIEKSGVPVVMPSANIFGNRPPKSARDVMDDLDNSIDMILDGGSTELGIESTVIDTTVFPYRILREGAISKAQIKDAWHHSAPPSF